MRALARNGTALILLTATALGLFGLYGHAHAAEGDMSRTITISATGSASAKPDRAIISTGVTSEAETARDAMDENSRRMRQVLSKLRDFDVAERDIQTTNFSVNPRYQNFKDGRPPKITGYMVTNSVRIRVRKIDQLGDILDKVVSLGANQIGGIQFEIGALNELSDRARKLAIEAAHHRAEVYTQAAGIALDEVIRIEESSSAGSPRPLAMRTSMRAEAGAPPFEAGEHALTVSVTVTWSLR